MQGISADTATRYGAQSQAREGGGWQVWTTSRCTSFCAGRGGGERVQKREVIRKRTVTNGGEVKWKREIEISRKTNETGGVGGLE